MKTLPPDLESHLQDATTTLCNCWVLIRNDGTAIGYTDHDAALELGGVLCEPVSGLDRTGITTSLGLGVGGFEVSGALALDGFNEADLGAGLYDGAALQAWLVNWSDPDQRHLISAGTIGEVRRNGPAFEAEVRGLAHELDQTQGRVFQFACDADLGDSRCGVDAESTAWSQTALVIATDGARTIKAAAMAEREPGFFSRGLATFTSGDNAGRSMEVLRHLSEFGLERLDLFQPMSASINVGDTFTLSAGCDKRYATCRDKFSNRDNFRGFPHMPGNDFALSYVRSQDENDGGARSQ